MQYFARPHAFRRWRFWLSVGVPLAALAWFLVQRTGHGQKIYSSGPLSQAHAVFTQQCALCHVTQAGDFSAQVTDNACLTCHDAPAHHANQTFTPACSNCHVEHKGAVLLQATSEAACTQCHANLSTREGQPHYVTSIARFDQRHPEISPLRARLGDPAGIRLNHYLHLQPNLMGPNNTRVQMACEDCHQPVISETRRAGSPGPSMPLPQFAKHCASCHTLQFDRRFGNEQVPHDKPEAVRVFLRREFEQYIAAHPADVYEVPPPVRDIPERVRPRRVARNAAEWVEFRVEDAEWLLYAKTCKQCHILDNANEPLPQIRKSSLTGRWLEHASFDHPAHRMMTCVACHSRTPDSRETEDILLPGIRTCQQCHQPEGASREAAEGRCFECHQYHDWKNAHPTRGTFTIPQLRGAATLP